jgi:hypothetical protein
MKNLNIQSSLPTFTVLSLLDDKGLSYAQLAHRLKVLFGIDVSRQAIHRAASGSLNSSTIRIAIAQFLGFKPSFLWKNVFPDDILEVDDVRYWAKERKRQELEYKKLRAQYEPNQAEVSGAVITEAK